MTCPQCGWILRRRPAEFGANVSFQCRRCNRFYLVAERFITS